MSYTKERGSKGRLIVDPLVCRRGVDHVVSVYIDRSPSSHKRKEVDL